MSRKRQAENVKPGAPPVEDRPRSKAMLLATAALLVCWVVFLVVLAVAK